MTTYILRDGPIQVPTQLVQAADARALNAEAERMASEAVREGGGHG